LHAVNVTHPSSRSTIDRAVHVLVDEGKLTAVKGWDVFVAERTG
jgi:DNA-binding GntR family transcriptional regulator